MFQSNSIYILMVTSGVLGGFGHCLGMCGPIVTSCSLIIKNKSMVPHLLYNLGRISTYAFLGGIVGMTGSLIGITGNTQVFQKVVMVLAGVLIMIMGMSLAGWFPFIVYTENHGNFFSSLSEKAKTIISGDVKVSSFFPAGILLGFIPCGLVYTALLAAARAGMDAENHFYGFLSGTVLMWLFGIGTMPSMLLLGKIANSISSKIRGHLYRLSAMIMIVMGLIFLLKAIKKF